MKTETESQLKVLLLGDSIRMSYQPWVTDLLKDRAEVVGPRDNCQFSLYTLASLNRWIEELGKPDVIHWNIGMHDCGHNPNRYPVQIPLEMYLANLDFIVGRLLEMTDRLIWATFTCVHPDRPFKTTEWSWRNEEIDRYNLAARDLVESYGIRVNDLHALILGNVDAYLAEDLLHLSETGQKAFAGQVAGAISDYLQT